MDITEKDLKEQYYKTIDGEVRTPVFTYSEFSKETGAYKNLVIIKTADEAYLEWLNNKNNLSIPTLTLEERIAMLENLQLQQEGVI